MGIGNRVSRVVRSPAFGLAMLTPIVLAGAVGAAPTHLSAPVYDADVTPLAAVSTPRGDSSGVTVVALTKQPTPFRVAASTRVRSASVHCGEFPWRDAHSGGRTGRLPQCRGDDGHRRAGLRRELEPAGRYRPHRVSARQRRRHRLAAAPPSTPIYGPALDGTLPGNEVIVQTVQAGRPMYARAIGPMQFLPGTWSRYASDGDRDGKADPQNVYDATLAAARYLCSGGLNLRNQSQVLTAILRYNNSMAYAQNVLGWAAAYATGVAPVELPPIVGPVPAIGDAHLESSQGLGPGMPFNATGLPATDPLSQMPLINFGNTETAGQLALGPLPGPAGMLPQQSPCEVICMGSQIAPATPAPEAAPPAWQPPWMLPPPPAPAAEPAPVPDAPAPLPATYGALPGPAA